MGFTATLRICVAAGATLRVGFVSLYGLSCMPLRQFYPYLTLQGFPLKRWFLSAESCKSIVRTAYTENVILHKGVQ